MIEKLGVDGKHIFSYCGFCDKYGYTACHFCALKD